jgi:hypothetical protein
MLIQTQQKKAGEKFGLASSDGIPGTHNFSQNRGKAHGSKSYFSVFNGGGLLP